MFESPPHSSLPKYEIQVEVAMLSNIGLEYNFLFGTIVLPPDNCYAGQIV